MEEYPSDTPKGLEDDNPLEEEDNDDDDDDEIFDDDDDDDDDKENIFDEGEAPNLSNIPSGPIGLVVMQCADCGVRWDSSDMQDLLLRVIGGVSDVLCRKCYDPSRKDFRAERGV